MRVFIVLLGAVVLLVGCTRYLQAPRSNRVALHIVEDEILYSQGDTLLLNLEMTNNDSISVPINLEYLSFRLRHNTKVDGYFDVNREPFVSFDSHDCPADCMPILRFSEWKNGIVKPFDWQIKCPDRCLIALKPGETRTFAIRFILLEPFSIYDTLQLVVESYNLSRFNDAPFLAMLRSDDTVTIVFDKRAD